MGKHLVFVGGGHAHLTALKNLSTFTERGHSVTLVSASPYHYYSGMGPGMLSGIYHASEVRFHIKKMAEDRGAAFIEDNVVKIDPVGHLLSLRSGGNVAYDVVSFNTGSEVPVGSIASSEQDNVVAVKPVVNLLKARHANLRGRKRGRCLEIYRGRGRSSRSRGLLESVAASQRKPWPRKDRADCGGEAYAGRT